MTFRSENAVERRGRRQPSPEKERQHQGPEERSGTVARQGDAERRGRGEGRQEKGNGAGGRAEHAPRTALVAADHADRHECGQQHAMIGQEGQDPPGPALERVARVEGDVHQHGRGEEEADPRFHQRVARRDRPRAVAATAAQEQPAEHGHVVPGGDRGAAVRAAGAGTDQALAPRQPPDTDVQEAPDRRPEHEPEHREDRVVRTRHDFPPGANGPAPSGVATPAAGALRHKPT